ncbi:phage tail tape measure protein [Paenibacillus sp. CAU 1782]
MDDLSAKAKRSAGGFDEAASAAKKLADTQTQIGRLTSVLDNTNAKIDVQRKRLADLKRSYDETFNDKDRGKLQAQIIQTEGALLSLEKTSDATAQKIWELEDSLESAGDSAEMMSNKTSASLTKVGVAYGALAAAMTAIIAKSVDTAAAFESSMARVQAMSGATAAEFKALEDQAISLGVSTVFSSSQVAEGQSFLAIAGFKANDIIAAMPGLLDLAAAAQMDLGRAADITSNILTGFRLEAEQTGRVSDVLAKAFTSSNTSMEQLGYAMRYAAPIAASLGVSVEETAAAIGILSNAGIQGEMAGTQLRAMFLRLVNPVGDAEKVIEQLGIKTADASGKILPFSDILRQLQTAMSGLTQSAQAEAAALIAGTEAASGFLTLVSTGADELERFTGELQDSGGTAQQIAETQMNTYNGALEEMRSALEGVGIAVGDDFKPAMRAAAEEVTRMLLGLAEMDSGTRTFIVTMLAAGTGAGALATAIYGMVTAMRALQAAGIAANAALGWIGAISAAVGLAAGAFMSYKVEAAEAAEAQRQFNEMLEQSPLSRTVDDVQALRDKAAELNDILEQRAELEERLATLRDEFAQAQSKSGGGFIAAPKELTEASNALSDLNDKLKQYGMTAEEAAAAIEEINREINQSTPALRELRMEELRDIAAKQDQIAESEKLLDRYNELRNQTSRTAEENEELTRTVRTLSERYPDLATELDTQGGLLITNESLIRDIITAENDALTARLEAEAANTESRRRETAAALEAAKKQITALKAVAAADTGQAEFLGGGPSLFNTALGEAAKKVESELSTEAARLQTLLNEMDTELGAIQNGTWRGLLGGSGSSGAGGGLSTGSGTLNLDGDKKSNKKDKTQTAEQIAQAAYRASLQALEKRRLLGDLTEQQEVDRLAALAETYKKYDDIWIDAESRRQRLISQMAAAEAKATEESARASEKAQRASYEKSAEWIELETQRMTERGESERAITEMQLEAWTRVRNRYGKDTEYFKRADREMYNARMDLRKQDERAAKEAADTAEKAAKASTKSFLDNIEKQRKAELSALDKRKADTKKHYDDILKIIDNAERGRERKSIVDEMEKYRFATSEKGRKRFEELQEQLRKMDVEDNKDALKQERDDKLAALDQQKADIDAWYNDLKSAAESFNGDMISLYQLTEDERLKAFIETNAEIKAEMTRFQAEMATITGQQVAAAAVVDPYQAAIAAQMKANSAAWKTYQSEGNTAAMAGVAAENKRLGAEIGGTYDSRTGRWFGADGLPLFHTGRDGLTGRTFNAGDMLMPDEVAAILRRDEYVFTPGQLRSLIDGAGRSGGTTVNIERIVGVEMNDTTLEDEIDVRAIGRVGVDMAAEMARNNYTGGA